MRYTALAATAAVMVSTTSAFALDSSVSMPSSLSLDALWKKVGNFCGISAWHPAIEKCELSADGKQRTLSLKGGGTIVEALEKWDDANHSYSYAILSGPLPVANYHSTISATGNAAGSALKWIGNYDAKGAPDADAKKTIDGIYESGAKALTGS
jgi:polyketide cyclase/dehydrase/lipid transport protein